MTVSRTQSFAVGLLAVGLVAWAAFGGEDQLLFPDPSLTPGSVIQGYQMMCSPPYSSPRVWHDKYGTLTKYGYPPSMNRMFEDDDRVPVCAGGNNADPENHWPQPCARWVGDRCVSGEAHDKDLLEKNVCRAICAGRMTLPQGQAIFLGDWRPFLGANL